MLSALLPWIVRLQIAPGDRGQELSLSLLGTLLAITLGYYGFRRLSNFPGTKAFNYILPCYVTSYSLMIVGFFFFRIDYSRLHLLLSFCICVAWYFFVCFKVQQQTMPQIAVVPEGDVERLFKINDVHWVRLPDVPETGIYSAIVADLRADLSEKWERFIADEALAGKMIMHVKQVEESLTGMVAIEHLSENNFGSLIPGIVYARIKRLADVVFTILALPLLTLVCLIIAVLIRMDSPGPVIFKQKRIGFRGERFTMFKFRSMKCEAGTSADPRAAAITSNADPRVTKIGRFLRRFRLDELPQFINILRGEMSWIGPRPEALSLSQWYEGELPFYRYRHIVRPGITGWAQVQQGHVAEVDEVLTKLHYDFYYIKNFSFWLDLLIVAATAGTVLNGRGAR